MYPGEIAVGESTFIDENLDPHEALRTFFLVAEERGHPSPSVVVDNTGRVLTHPDYSDRAGYFHPGAGAWTFCRRPRSESLGFLSGTDWVRDHSLHLMFMGGSPWYPSPHYFTQPYIEELERGLPVPLSATTGAEPPAWSNDGRHIAVVEERRGAARHTPGLASHLVWEYEPVLGSRRLVTRFPSDYKMGPVSVSYSPCDSWLLLSEFWGGRATLVRLADGQWLTLDKFTTSIGWDHRWPNCVVFAEFDASVGDVAYVRWNLATGATERLVAVRGPAGRSLSICDFDLSPDGAQVVVTASVGASGLQLGRRGGLQIASIVDLDSGVIEPILPVDFKTPGAERRHTAPRWCWPRRRWATPLVLSEALVAKLGRPPCALDPPAVTRGDTDEWVESAFGIIEAFAHARLLNDSLRRELAQFVLAVQRVDEGAARPVLDELERLARLEPVAREVLASIRRAKDRGSSVIIETSDQPRTPVAPVGPTLTSDHLSELERSLDRFIAAETLPGVFSAAQRLVRYTPPDEQTWPWLAALARTVCDRKGYGLAAKLGLALSLWQDSYLPEDTDLAYSGLDPCPPALQVPIALAGFVAAMHLPEREVIGKDRQALFDAGDVLERCQARLSQLDVEGFIRGSGSPDQWSWDVLEAARRRQAEPGALPVRRERQPGTVFLSYMHDDRVQVERIEAALRASGLEVWRDVHRIHAGEHLQTVIARQIRTCAHFVVCLSSTLHKHPKTYVRRELEWALECVRSEPELRGWFVPLQLDEGELPSLGAGIDQLLREVLVMPMHRDFEASLQRLAASLGPLSYR